MTKKYSELPHSVIEWYLEYAQSTWRSIDAMIYPQTGLPSDHLHYQATFEMEKIDKTSPTNIGFALACTGAANDMGIISTKEALDRLSLIINTINKLTNNSDTFISLKEKKGVLVNWIQPSTAEVLSTWPQFNTPVKQQLSSVDNAWLIAFSKMIAEQYPILKKDVENLLNKIDISCMFDFTSGYFYGCYDIEKKEFENWQYDVISEARLTYLISSPDISRYLTHLLNNRSEKSIFITDNGLRGRSTWDGSYFVHGWINNILNEGEYNEQWRETYLSTIQAQKEFGFKYSNGYYGFSPGIGPDNKYYEYRVPTTGECTTEYTPQPIINISSLINMGIQEPEDTIHTITRLYNEFPNIRHSNYGDGDTVNVLTGEVQKDQIFPNQATSLLSCWNITRESNAQKFFTKTLDPKVLESYTSCSLF